MNFRPLIADLKSAIIIIGGMSAEIILSPNEESQIEELRRKAISLQTEIETLLEERRNINDRKTDERS